MTLAIDGTASTFWGNLSTTTLSLTTSDSDDVIVVAVANDNPSSYHSLSSVTASGLTFVKRKSHQLSANADYNLEYWWAHAASPLASATITLNFPASINHGTAVAFGISGAHTAAPWDPNGSLPAVAEAVSGTPNVSGMSSTDAIGMSLLFGASWDHWWTDGTPPSGYSSVAEADNNNGASDSVYYPSLIVASDDFSSALSSTTATWSGFSNSNPWALIGDSILDTSEGGGGGGGGASGGIGKAGRRRILIVG